jgi:hypothetical protein
VACFLTIGLPTLGITGYAYQATVGASYLIFIVLAIINFEPAAPVAKKYAGFKPTNFYIAFVIECALAFGLPLIGIAAGTLTWWIAVGVVGVIAAYLGITALNRHIDDTNNQIIIDVWGKDLHHRRV